MSFNMVVVTIFVGIEPLRFGKESSKGCISGVYTNRFVAAIIQKITLIGSPKGVNVHLGAS